MKKRKWLLWAIIPVIYSILRYAGGFYFAKEAMNQLNIDVFDNFEYAGWLGSVVLYIICFVGLCVSYGKVKKDFKNNDENADMPKYHFWLLIPLTLIKVIFDVIAMANWELNAVYMAQDIDRLNGLDVTLGHPSGLITGGAVVMGFLLFVIICIISIIWQVNYKKVKNK